MDRTPPPVSLTAALALPRTPERSAEVFVDGALEIRFAARPRNGPQVPHQRDELYFVAAGTGRYRVEDEVTAVGSGDLPFCAARVAHGFEDISADFSVWVLFYGPRKRALAIGPIARHSLLPRRHTGEGRYPWREKVPAFAGTTRRKRVGGNSAKIGSDRFAGRRQRRGHGESACRDGARSVRLGSKPRNQEKRG